MGEQQGAEQAGVDTGGRRPHTPQAPAAPAMDRLERIFAAQGRVTAETGVEPTGYPIDTAGRVSSLSTAIIHEATELQNTTAWKWWKRHTPGYQFDEAHAKEELIDILHFAIQAAIVLGMSPDDLVAEYERKAAINVQRQRSGY